MPSGTRAPAAESSFGVFLLEPPVTVFLTPFIADPIADPTVPTDVVIFFPKLSFCSSSSSPPSPSSSSSSPPSSSSGVSSSTGRMVSVLVKVSYVSGSGRAWMSLVTFSLYSSSDRWSLYLVSSSSCFSISSCLPLRTAESVTARSAAIAACV